MNQILVEHDPSPMKLEVLGVDDWDECVESVSVQERFYAQTETTFIQHGRAEVIPEGGSSVLINAGDLVTLLAETRCVWNITEPMTRYFRAG